MAPSAKFLRLTPQKFNQIYEKLASKLKPPPDSYEVDVGEGKVIC